MKRKPPRIEVDWIDAWLLTEETKPEDFAGQGLQLRTTEGRLIHEDAVRILVASTLDTNGHADGIWAIPVVLITARRYPGRRAQRTKVSGDAVE